MKKFVPIILLVFFLFISCEPKLVKEGREVYREYLSKNLKDPNSLKIYNESYYLPNGKDGIISEFTVDYGATNSYGAMVRDELKFKIVAKKITEINDINYFNNKLNTTNSDNYSVDKIINKETKTSVSQNKDDFLFGEWVIKQKYDTNRNSYQHYNSFNSDKSTLSFLGNNYISLSDYKKNSYISFFGKYIIKDSIYYLSKNDDIDGNIKVISYKQNEVEILLNLDYKTNKYIISRIIQ